MTSLFTKLNLKEHKTVLVLNAPASFETKLGKLQGVSVVRSVSDVTAVSFAIVFVQSVEDIATAASTIFPKAPGDPIIWFSYPKASSKRYRCGFNRDTGWDAIGQAGFEGVRQVAIDEDWSALRFRRVEHVKTMIRDSSRASSPEGKARTKRP